VCKSGCKGTSIHFLTSLLLPYSPLVHMYFSHTSIPSPGTTLKADNFPEVDSLKVINFLLLPPLVPQQHQTSHRYIGTCSCDTTAPSAVIWIATCGRLGTRRLGTVIRPSQGSLEHSL
jgi:hypothetical protein